MCIRDRGHFRERTYLLARRRAASASRTPVARTYQKDGETKTVRDFVVEDLKIERRKIGHQVE